MKQIAAASLAFAALTAGAQTTSYNQVQHVHTALNHLTVVELGEPITTLAVADPDAFSVENHGDKVFLKPTRDNVSTNLFVWTATRQVSYELDPVGDVAKMDVLIRALPSTPSHTAVAQLSPEPKQNQAELEELANLVATQVLAGSQDIQRDDKSTPDGRVSVKLDQVFRAKDATYIRYTITNKSDHPYRASSPVVEMMLPTVNPAALAGYKNHQLRTSTAESFKAARGNSIAILKTVSPMKDIAPSEQETGVVGFRDSASNPPALLQIQLGTDVDHPVTADAVL